MVETLLLMKTILILFTLFVIYKLIRWLITYFYQLWVYSYIPGCATIPFIGNAFEMMKTKSDNQKMTFELVKRFNHVPFFRLYVATQPLVIFHTADNLEIVFNDNRFLDKSFDYTFLHDWLGLGLLTSGGDKWFHRRKMLTPSFHFDILKDFLPVMDEHANTLVNKLKKLDKTDNVLLQTHLALCTLDVICETTMGYNLNTQNDMNKDYVNAVNKMCELVLIRTKKPWLWSDFAFYNFSKLGKEQRDCLNMLHGFTKKVIKERSEDFNGLCTTNKNRIAFLDLLLDIWHKDPNKISLDNIQEEVDTFMFEGHDTTASGLTWILFLIAKHPSIQKKLHEEIDLIFGNSSRQITLNDLSNMTYLECVIKEGLRLFPPVPIIARELNEDAVVGGYQLLKGCTIPIFLFAINRDERYFPDPNEFIPDRFLDENNNNNRHPYSYVPFSAGKRNCIGQKFAMMELKVVLSNVLRNFEIGCDQTIDEIKICFDVVTRPENPISFKLTKRNHI